MSLHYHEKPDPEVEEGLEIEPSTTSTSSSSIPHTTASKIDLGYIGKTTEAANPLIIDVGDKIIVLGQSRSGKTTLIERLIRDNQHKFNLIWVICGTIGVSENYLWNEPFLIQLDLPTLLGEDDHMSQLKKIIRAQQYIAVTMREKKQPIPSMLIIFDDCMSANFYKEMNYWGSWLSSLRHYGSSVIFSLQSLHSTAPPLMRSQYDKAYILRNHTDPRIISEIINGVWFQGKNYTGRQGADLIQEITAEPYQCAFFDNLNGVNGHVFKAKPAPSFTLAYGSRGSRGTKR